MQQQPQGAKGTEAQSQGRTVLTISQRSRPIFWTPAHAREMPLLEDQGLRTTDEKLVSGWPSWPISENFSSNASGPSAVGPRLVSGSVLYTLPRELLCKVEHWLGDRGSF